MRGLAAIGSMPVRLNYTIMDFEKQTRRNMTQKLLSEVALFVIAISIVLYGLSIAV